MSEKKEDLAARLEAERREALDGLSKIDPAFLAKLFGTDKEKKKKKDPNKEIINALLKEGQEHEDKKEYEAAYSIWQQLAEKYNHGVGWERMGHYLYTGTVWKSKAAAIFCWLKSIRADGEDQVLDELEGIYKDNERAVEQIKLIREFMNQDPGIDDKECRACKFRDLNVETCERCCDKKLRIKMLNKMVNELENSIYGKDKPKDLSDFVIV